MSVNDKDLINQLIKKIGSDFEPVMVPVRPEPYARPANCFPNVTEKVKRNGGSIVCGWSVLLGQFLVEAERHAVWRSSQDELIDITPSTSKMLTTLFIPEHLAYTGQYIDNIRINATANKVVDDWIIVATLRSKILNTATRNGDYITFPLKMNSFYYKYEELNNFYYSYLLYGGTDETKCFCQSRKPYRACHGLKNNDDCRIDSERIDHLRQ